MDTPQSAIQSTEPTTQASGIPPTLDPQLLEIVRQAQAKAVQDATAQVKQQFDAEWERRKKMVDEEWNRREAAYLKQLEDAQAALNARTIQQGQAAPA